jgi:hypothetical protein
VQYSQPNRNSLAAKVHSSYIVEGILARDSVLTGSQDWELAGGSKTHIYLAVCTQQDFPTYHLFPSLHCRSGFFLFLQVAAAPLSLLC